MLGTPPKAFPFRGQSPPFLTNCFGNIGVGRKNPPAADLCFDVMGAEWSPTLRSRSPSSPSSQASRHCLTQGSRMEAQSPWSMGGWLWDSSPCLWGLPWERFARLSPHLGDSTTGALSWLDLSGVPLHHGSQDGMQSLMLPKDKLCYIRLLLVCKIA